MPNEFQQADIVSDDCLPAEDPLPFEKLWLPFVISARQQLLVQCADEYPQLGADCRRALERHLLCRLCETAAATTFTTFSDFRTATGNESAYIRFTREHLEQGTLFR